MLASTHIPDACRGPYGRRAAQQKPQAKPAQGQADPAKPALVQQFGDWGTFATAQSKASTCYALSQPKQRAPAALKRDPAYVFVTHRPADKVRNEIAIIMGFEVKPDSKPMADVGGAEFELVAKGEHLWLRNAADESKFIAALRKGPRLTIKAQFAAQQPDDGHLFAQRRRAGARPCDQGMSLSRTPMVPVCGAFWPGALQKISIPSDQSVTAPRL